MASTREDPHHEHGLPDDFFERLTEKQRVLLEILADEDGEYVRGVEIRRRMREDYGMTVPNHTGALNGILSGLSRKYSREFRRTVIPGRWVDGGNTHVEFRIGPEYAETINDHLR